jgi:glycerophosphoryl diester phosphodiesterase
MKLSVSNESGNVRLAVGDLVGCAFLVGCLSVPTAGQETRDRPLIIAHRGASGYLPEHTLPAYAMAHAMGADFVEPDLVRTRDGAFICLHDIHLEDTTDVETRFPDRKRADGRWYAADFDLAEIRLLRAHERLKGRFPPGRSSFQVPTFEEMIELVEGLNRTSGRSVGIYPELKAGEWHRTEGLVMEESFLEIARSYDLGGEGPPVFVQSFEAGSLRRLRELGSKMPQIMLMGAPFPEDPSQGKAMLADIASFAQGIGPSKTILRRQPEVVKWAHERNLEVHPYTLRADDLGEGVATFEEELELYYSTYGVDGLFTDFPDRARAWLQSQP